ncbi:MAG TPA: efflux RND transporter periplasmic adaptor subunit, partial [Devosia sp.]|nr:efflux RND transporter periplasmic adaptor subunit [Devosia sp.]
MDQEKIDLTRALPASPPTSRRGAPFWLQLLISLVVVAAAAVLFVIYFPGASGILSRIGITLPAAETAAPETQVQAQGQGQARTGQGAGTAPAGGQQSGSGSGQFGGRGGFGSFGARQAAVVVIAPVGVATINDKLTAVGEGSAVNSVSVVAPSGGTLMSVLVKPGDRIEAGDKLAELDSQSQQIAYDRAKLAAEDAERALARANELAKNNSLSDVQLAQAQLTADNARLELRNAELSLSQRTITTPIAGTVGLIQAAPGNQINAQTVLTTIEDSSEIQINFWVPERYAGQIQQGMKVTAGSVAIAGLTFDGTITAVDNRIDPASRTLQVQASLPNPDGKIRAGMSFSVTMGFPGETFPTVDPLSIQWSSEGAYVWRYVDGKVQKAMVDIVQRNTDGVLVKGDIAEGDQVVTQGVLQLSDGASVR